MTTLRVILTALVVGACGGLFIGGLILGGGALIHQLYGYLLAHLPKVFVWGFVGVIGGNVAFVYLLTVRAVNAARSPQMFKRWDR